MSPRLKPLLLPQLVEERRKLELQQAHEGDHTYVYYTDGSSSSDLTLLSPLTPTFSCASYSRLSGSASSLEMTMPSCSNSPASPLPLPQLNKTSKSPLPDVKEDPLEREEEEESTAVPEHSDREFDLYDCLCDVPCSHHGDATQSASMYSWTAPHFDYDLGFLSDSDVNGGPRPKKRRHGFDSGFSSWDARLGSKFQSFTRWRSASTSRRHPLTFSPASDPSLADQRRSFSHNASSRSSSVSGQVQTAGDRTEDPAPATPALSLYESSENIAQPSPLDTLPAALGHSLERERASATTPLLPPLLSETGGCHTQPQSLQVSPLQSPAMVPSPMPELPAASRYPTPPLSAKPSVSSFRRGTVSSISDAPSPIPCFFDHQDSWSDRLGHANFTIEPKPYQPETADLATFQAFRADWNQARTNYAKHLVRTGEHYGATSKTYALTEAKWAEIEEEWRRNETELIRRLEGLGLNGDPVMASQLRRMTEETLPSAIPRMLSDDGKFPELGDVEIVGPMAREATMARDGSDEKRNSASVWLKNLAEKVGLRR
ncbi:hypothetical protein VTK56DRAFT_5990 [Thermocarpiscus australiensis]